MNIGHKIKKLRKLNNLSQENLANILGISSSTISRYENGKRHISLDTLQKIAATLYCDITYFTNNSNTKYTFIATNLDSKSYHSFLLLKKQLEQNDE